MAPKASILILILIAFRAEHIFEVFKVEAEDMKFFLCLSLATTVVLALAICKQNTVWLNFLLESLAKFLEILEFLMDVVFRWR